MKQVFPFALGLVALSGISDSIYRSAAAQAADSPSSSAEIAQAEVPVATEVESSSQAQDAIALNFEPPAAGQPQPASTTPAPEPAPSNSASSGESERPSREDLFAGGSESIVARTVGAAEGTRSPDGGKTDIYDGHVDPGNGVWNRGTFSYQFGNEENLSAEEADRRQVAKIKRIHESVMLPKAKQHGIDPLTLAEEINGIDLINQAPLAVTEEGGYIERLAQAKQEKGLTGHEAILDARVWAFWDSAKGGWDAPGLRAYDDMGKEASIRHDQKRRMGMIDQALASLEQQGQVASKPTQQPPQSVAVQPSDHPSGTPVAVASSEPAKPQAETTADLIIFGNPVQPDTQLAIARS
ncbi:MAG: hypothetical protein IGS48_13030 [Oscillatoriales cyanobacterium C42_A2020_001]|nr:hypothetical protein [Leptolyngbyaceae cyanobacterium C42_A2020_001]